MSKGAQIALATLSIFIGVALLVTFGGAGEGTFAYYSTVSAYTQASTETPVDGGRRFRVHGFVVDGSIQKDLGAGTIDFIIGDEKGASLPVRLLGIEVPDLFGDGAEVVVEGEQQGSTFLARRVLAKCPSKYEVAPGTEA
jgi:cytochrome c-type biogenesis protein CcmE